MDIALPGAMKAKLCKLPVPSPGSCGFVGANALTARQPTMQSAQELLCEQLKKQRAPKTANPGGLGGVRGASPSK